MKCLFKCFVIALLVGAAQITFAQGDRIRYNNEDLFLSGANLAWIKLAKDIGPGPTAVDCFADVLLQMHDHGGNALRWWLHTNGKVTPAFNSSDSVIGPGEGAIDDIKEVLRLAKEREIGLILCLWSYNMLDSLNSPDVIKRNKKLLLESNYTYAYIDSCLIPMIKALKGDSAIIAWEIFNEPEYMSKELGASPYIRNPVKAIDRVPMSAIQTFINRCASAINSTDSSALVTNGAWNFSSLTDTCRLSLTNSCLVAAGGKSDGTLNFYSVHYYTGWGSDLSPFQHHATRWELDKPIVVAEFNMKDTLDDSTKNLFETLYQNGYAGALPWSWTETDTKFSTPEEMLAGMKFMWDNHREDVDVHGIGGDWPNVIITSPANDTKFPVGAAVTIKAAASDSDGTVVLVEFFASDKLKIGEARTAPYTITWTNVPTGFYTLTAVATDDRKHKRVSDQVSIKVGTPQVVRLEAERAALNGTPKVLCDPTASNRAYLTMKEPGTITWQVPNTQAAGRYEIVFGYRLPYESKRQYVNVNGVRVDTVRFDGNLNVWLTKEITVNLVGDNNAIQIELDQGWMDLDYMDIPCLTSVADHSELPVSFSLQQNHPNPFNPATTIRYSLAKREHVKLVVYDLMGRSVKVLIDKKQNAGPHEISFDGQNLATGVYFYRLETGSFVDEKRMLLVK